MITSRYAYDGRVYSEQMGTAIKVRAIRYALKSGIIHPTAQFLLSGDDRLDTMAGKIYGDARYWWVLAAASNIGWGMQPPPGTLITVVNLTDLERL